MHLFWRNPARLNETVSAGTIPAAGGCRRPWRRGRRPAGLPRWVRRAVPCRPAQDPRIPSVAVADHEVRTEFARPQNRGLSHRLHLTCLHLCFAWFSCSSGFADGPGVSG